MQSRLRIVHNRSVDEAPEAAEELDKLARRLGYESGGRFVAEREKHTKQIRELFRRLVERERG